MTIDSHQSVECGQHMPGAPNGLSEVFEWVVAEMVELLCGICLCLLLDETPAGNILQ